MKKPSVLLLVTSLLTTLTIGCSPVTKSSIESNGTGIIGGTEVVEDSPLHQSIVGIYDFKNHSLCTGSLIASNIVLTAAHCLTGNASDQLIVFSADLIGTLKRTQSDKTILLQKVRRGVKAILHDEWGKKHVQNQAWGDIALIRFAGSAPEGFKPATFISSSSLLSTGAEVTVAGYGVSSNILVPVDPRKTPDFKQLLDDGKVFCENEDDSTEKCFREEVSGEGLLRTTEIKVEGHFNNTEVVLNQSKGRASCEGDSGGPAYLKVNGEYHLWGVTSRGTRGCNGFVIYTDAVAQRDWINLKLAEILK